MRRHKRRFNGDRHSAVNQALEQGARLATIDDQIHELCHRPYVLSELLNLPVAA